MVRGLARSSAQIESIHDSGPAQSSHFFPSSEVMNWLVTAGHSGVHLDCYTVSDGRRVCRIRKLPEIILLQFLVC